MKNKKTGGFAPTERHIKILEEIGKNKVISLQDLYRESKTGTTYERFSTVLCFLEEKGLVDSIRGHQKRKYFFLTNEGSSHTKYEAPHAQNTASLKHDMAAAKALKSLLALENFHEGHITLEDNFSDIVPDAVIKGSTGEREYVLGVEVELTQKSKHRIIDKFIKYESCEVFDCAIYLIQDKPVFDFYKRTISSMDEVVQEKILLIFCEGLERKGFDVTNKRCFFKGESKNFVDCLSEMGI